MTVRLAQWGSFDFFPAVPHLQETMMQGQADLGWGSPLGFTQGAAAAAENGVQFWRGPVGHGMVGQMAGRAWVPGCKMAFSPPPPPPPQVLQNPSSLMAFVVCLLLAHRHVHAPLHIHQHARMHALPLFYFF